MFLPVSNKDLEQRSINQVDFILISGDAYIDHPSFGVAIIARVLEAFGYIVAILPQPNIGRQEDFTQFGTPKLGFLITSGNIDSMVNHFSVSKRRRDKDYYSEAGEMGKRPDHAVIVYSNIVRRLFPNSAIILGGIEASLRRLAHYDYIENKLMQSILVDSKADLLCYGMAEKTMVEVADALASGLEVSDIIYLRGTVWKTTHADFLPNQAIQLPKYKELLKDRRKFAQSFHIQYQNTDPYQGLGLVEEYDQEYVVQNPPAYPLEQEYLDWVYALPYERAVHPMYQKGVPAIEEVQHSIVANRGCMGSCSFCALTFHQGRIMQSRSKESIIKEGEAITNSPNFKGYIHDVGGPTANFYVKACSKQDEYGACKDKLCLHPKKCNQLIVTHQDYLDILRSLRKLPKVKKVFVRSGIRYDYLMYDKDDTFFQELVQHHISGQLKVAPEHVSNRVLDYMQKPRNELYEKFVEKYEEMNRKYQKNQFLVPYLMSSHPGSQLEDAILLAEYLKKNRVRVEQVQDFYPTPGTLSTCMYYTQLDPRTMEPVYVATKPHEKAMQRALIQYHKANNYWLVKAALEKAGRTDLIGEEPQCLIKNKKIIKKQKLV